MIFFGQFLQYQRSQVDPNHLTNRSTLFYGICNLVLDTKCVNSMNAALFPKFNKWAGSNFVPRANIIVVTKNN